MDLEFDKAASRLKKEQKARVDKEKQRREREKRIKEEADKKNAELEELARERRAEQAKKEAEEAERQRIEREHIETTTGEGCVRAEECSCIWFGTYVINTCQRNASAHIRSFGKLTVVRSSC